MNRKDEKGSDTNFGWWADKPEREERPTTFHAPLSNEDRPQSGFSWTAALLIVALMTAFVWSVKSLAGW
ncbi:hypothetical protein QTH90_04870 [Variovorax sp. J2P1-59]|uniref:hypothetical protein n=1 Tax=Variovorax flavidus TaxID=3053501 RepID=UPI0025761746|nr:hypothetical protein [Variovorax sp. J2P1-59]MDM0073699.1 hypothetical protein [Variovorax sp. J2P1-59]